MGFVTTRATFTHTYHAKCNEIFCYWSRVEGVFFSNGDKFLAIFKETLWDLRERLAEARERRLEVIREREVRDLAGSVGSGIKLVNEQTKTRW